MPRVLPLDPATYARHACHTRDRDWAETNCYSDVVIEMLHGMGHEPLAAMSFTLASDWEVDQWTFFKFPHQDVEELFGLEIHEMAPWRELHRHVADQVEAGRLVLVEMDSFYLPDTQGAAYRLAHVKSTVAVNEIDLAAGRMAYFHNQGFHWVEGDDFRALFQLDGLVHPRMLPPYIEVVKPLPRARALQGEALAQGALACLRRQLERAPATNPFPRFRAAFERDLAWLVNEPIDSFHAYSFVTFRQYGANYELAAAHLRWLAERGFDPGAADCFAAISRDTKAMQFALARAVARKKPVDFAPLEAMAARWDEGMSRLREALGT